MDVFALNLHHYDTNIKETLLKIFLNLHCSFTCGPLVGHHTVVTAFQLWVACLPLSMVKAFT